ncbi:type I DNA topoisomerase [Candidatus Dojkabacteria bacterium]|nr:type I DNA topoisomerase [Candidatus Dojkabacteria bacterium]
MSKTAGNLLVVESPAKSKTIERFLGSDYKVVATLGHMKDLPPNKFGVDIEKDFKPQYVVSKGKQKVITDLKSKIKNIKGIVYLATDPDREGEAIAWQVDNIAKKEKKQTKRVVFHEITKEAVTEALKNPREVDINLVDAQKARRILDRIVGFELSELLWKKIRYGLSAGRVQSVALKFIVDREKEILAFIPKEFFTVKGLIGKLALLLMKENTSLASRLSAEEVEKVKKDLKGTKTGIVKSVVTKQREFSAPPPYTTALLQQDANRKLGFSASRTMGIAQKLYQGVQIKGEALGLITYMRTDSFTLSQKAIKEIRNTVTKRFGEKYLSEKINVFKKKSKVAQEAHEAIRPTHLDLDPEKIKDSLAPEEYKLYRLIYNRALMTQMKQVSITETVLKVLVKEKYIFGAVAKSLVFDGFAVLDKGYLSLYVGNEGNSPDLSFAKEGEKITFDKYEFEKGETKPKARYTEATLIKRLEKEGVGRPSTYATIIKTIIDRTYVEKQRGKLHPTDMGIVVSDFLTKFFTEVVDSKFTAQMEDELDDIANGDKDRVSVLKEYYKPFHKKIESGHMKIKKEDVVVLEESKEKCPVCGGPMVVKIGRNGKFLSCKKFPECKGILSLEEQKLDMEKYEDPGKCKSCKGDLVLKTGKYGKFWACENYPKCKETVPLILRERCPECGSNLVERKGKWGRTFIGCSGYPKCKYIKKDK